MAQKSRSKMNLDGVGMQKRNKIRRHNLEPPAGELTFKQLMEYVHRHGVGNRLDAHGNPLEWNRTDWDNRCTDLKITLSYGTFRGWKDRNRQPKTDDIVQRFCRIIAPANDALRGEWKCKIRECLEPRPSRLERVRAWLASRRRMVMAGGAAISVFVVAGILWWVFTPPLRIVSAEFIRVTPPGYLEAVHSHETSLTRYVIALPELREHFYVPEWQGRARVEDAAAGRRGLSALTDRSEGRHQLLTEVLSANVLTGAQKAFLAEAGIGDVSVRLMSENPAYKEHLLTNQIRDLKGLSQALAQTLETIDASMGCSYVANIRIENRTRRNHVVSGLHAISEGQRWIAELHGPARFVGRMQEIPTSKPVVDYATVARGESALRSAIFDFPNSSVECGLPPSLALKVIGDADEDSSVVFWPDIARH